MRMIIAVIIAAVIATAANLLFPGSSFAQTGWQSNNYNRCAALASQQGLNPKSKSGRRFVDRCMQRGTYGSSPNCPDDPRARSAYPAWMCR
jgi:hypothetical protein